MLGVQPEFNPSSTRVWKPSGIPFRSSPPSRGPLMGSPPSSGTLIVTAHRCYNTCAYLAILSGFNPSSTRVQPKKLPSGVPLRGTPSVGTLRKSLLRFAPLSGTSYGKSPLRGYTNRNSAPLFRVVSIYMSPSRPTYCDNSCHHSHIKICIYSLI